MQAGFSNFPLATISVVASVLRDKRAGGEGRTCKTQLMAASATAGAPRTRCKTPAPWAHFWVRAYFELRKSGQESFWRTSQKTTEEVSREEKTDDNGETQQTKEFTAGLANHYWTSKASRQQTGEAESKEFLKLVQKPTQCLYRAGTNLPGTDYTQEAMSSLKAHL